MLVVVVVMVVVMMIVVMMAMKVVVIVVVDGDLRICLILEQAWAWVLVGHGNATQD